MKKRGGRGVKKKKVAPPPATEQHISLPKPSKVVPSSSTFPFYICFLTAILPISDPIRIIISFLLILSKPPSLGPLSVAFKPKYQVLGHITRWSTYVRSAGPQTPTCSTMGRNGKIYVFFIKNQNVKPRAEIDVFDHNGEYSSSIPLVVSGQVSTMTVDPFGNLVVVDYHHEGEIILKEFSEETHQNISNWSCSGALSQRIAISKSGLIFIPQILPEDQIPSDRWYNRTLTQWPVKLCVYSRGKTLLSASEHDLPRLGLDVVAMGTDEDENLMMGLSKLLTEPEISILIFSKFGEFLRKITLDLVPGLHQGFFLREILLDKNGSIGAILPHGSLVIFGPDGSFKEEQILGSCNCLLGTGVDENGTFVSVFADSWKGGFIFWG